MKKEDDWKIGLRCNATGCMDAATTDDGFCLLHGAQTAGTSAQQPTERSTAMHGNSGRVTDNGATMTAAELIDLLKRHPKACGVLGLRPNCEFVDTIRWCESFPRITPDCPMDDVEFACLWVLGAAQSKADELSVAVWFEDSPSGDGYVCGKYDADDELILYKTRLHALVEGIEAVA